MSGPRLSKSKIHAPRRLATLLRQAQKKGRKVVFTNGCFDLLHKGHVNTLEKARRLGDLLVVALNSDASVRRLKGPTRPVNDLSARAQVLAALEAVDYVTSFGEDDPLRLILALRPDVLVKGGDWKPSQIIGSREVLSWGGKVRSIRYVQGHSTTGILARAARRGKN